MRRLLLTITTLTSILVPAYAQQDDDASRGVARVSVIAGDVSVRRGDSGDNVTATLNAPLVAQDRVVTGPGARAEVQFDFANMVRLASNTEVRLAELQYQRYQLNIPAGLVTFRVWQNSNAEVDINTPVASLRPMRKGEYRVQVLEDGTTEIAVRDGELDIYTPQGSRRLGAGRSLIIRREANGEPSFQTSGNLPLDSWDQWNQSRDRELAASRSNQYLPQGVYGGEQLDNYGDWTYQAPYGYVWSPRVVAGWAPYRTGRWTWLDWYGWSWVSYDPWGWAPYHYGRWFYASNRWCWWPGAFGPRHYWSPALVSFIGFGAGHFNIGVGFGWNNVGWVPLAPYESYNRWWGRPYYGGRYGNYNNITVVNNVNITNIYRNARVDGGVSYVEASNFNRGVAYHGNNSVHAARASDLNNASEFRGPVGIAPSRESVRFNPDDGVRGGSARFSPREDNNFTSRRQAAQVERVPFEQQRQNVEQFARGSGMVRQTEGVRGGDNGWRRVGERDVTAPQQQGVRGGGADGFVQRDGGIRGGGNPNAATGSDGFRRSGGSDRAVESRGNANSEGFVTRQPSGTRGGDNGNGNGNSGWSRFGEAGVRGGGSNSNGFVQRGGETRSIDLGDTGNSRSRGVGAVDVTPRIVERPSNGNGDSGVRGGGSNRGNSTEMPQILHGNQGSTDSFGGGRGGSNANSNNGNNGNSGWGSFGGVRGGSSEPRSIERSSPGNSGYGGFRGGGGGSPAPQMSSPPSGGGFRGGGGGSPAPQMSAPSGGGGGSRGGGGAAPSGGGGGHSGGGHGGGRRGGGQ